MWANPQKTADFVTFTEEVLNGKLSENFLCNGVKIALLVNYQKHVHNRNASKVCIFDNVGIILGNGLRRQILNGKFYFLWTVVNVHCAKLPESHFHTNSNPIIKSDVTNFKYWYPRMHLVPCLSVISFLVLGVLKVFFVPVKTQFCFNFYVNVSVSYRCWNKFEWNLIRNPEIEKNIISFFNSICEPGQINNHEFSTLVPNKSLINLTKNWKA